MAHQNATYIELLKQAIRRLHGVDSTHVETVPVKETFNGQTIWDGNVEVFDLYDHSQAKKVYAWTHETDDPDKPQRQVTVLHIPPVTSPQLAVRAVIISDFKKS
jgi:hypothetical protein